MLLPADTKFVRQQISDDAEALAAAAAELGSFVRHVARRLEERGEIRVRTIDAGAEHVKPVDSILRKLDEKRSPPAQVFDDVGDLVRSRVVVHTLSDVDALVSALATDGDSPLAKASVDAIDNDAGYRATHINGRIGRFGAEIQLRTAAADAWAVVSRADVYRQDKDDSFIESLARSQSHAIRGVDEALQTLRDRRRAITDDDIPDAKAELNRASSTAQPPTLSSRRRPPGQQALDSAIERLPREDQHVVQSPVTQERVDELRDGIASYLRDQSIRRLFELAGSLETSSTSDEDRQFGLGMLTFKGPFVSGSNWAQDRPGVFARAIEDFLMRRFVGCLEARLVSDSRPLGSVSEVKQSIAAATERLVKAGRTPDLIVLITGADKRGDVRQLLREFDWRPSEQQLRGEAIGNIDFVRGTLVGLPVLEYRSSEATPSLHVLDLADYRYRELVPEGAREPITLSVRPVDVERALDLLAKHEDWPEQLRKPATGSATGDFGELDAVVQLMLRAELELLASGDIVEAYEPGTASFPLHLTDQVE